MINGTCVLKKKGYSTAILVILLLLGIIFGILYYLLSSDETVMIKIGNSNNQNNEIDFEIDSYCSNCGAPLPKNIIFCSNCGSKIKEEEPLQLESEDFVEVESEEY